jgi:hypothetical protein
MRSIAVSVISLLALGAGVAVAADPAPAGSSSVASSPSRYTFSWPLSASTPGPHGGTSRGAPVTVDSSESPAWRKLHEPGLSAFERDRRAILAIAGDYRANFDFLEVATYTPGANRDSPYQSWGTERVYVDQDKGNFISLVHVLELRTVKDDGTVSEPMVQKHWREDWQYEPKQLIEFRGGEAWQRHDLQSNERRGVWSQTVSQVDDSPRYSSIGHWDHSADFSTWISGDTWRPLPRRESRRKDYQVLLGTNRVTITPVGWLQEENNLKTVLTSAAGAGAPGHYLAREYGVARYERLKDADFTVATQYFERTKAFWDKVHSAWLNVYERNRQVTLHEPADREHGPQAKLFDYADELGQGKPAAPNEAQMIEAALRDVGAPVQVSSTAKAPADAVAAAH